uniref:Uncharacterized protein n=1 Tax=Meloidogyne incognita TaxID=6306 RepID=A0A914LGW9_MELIC
MQKTWPISLQQGENRVTQIHQLDINARHEGEQKHLWQKERERNLACWTIKALWPCLNKFHITTTFTTFTERFSTLNQSFERIYEEITRERKIKIKPSKKESTNLIFVTKYSYFCLNISKV